MTGSSCSLYLQGIIGAKLLRYVVWAVRHGPSKDQLHQPAEELTAEARALLDKLGQAGGELDAQDLQSQLNMPWRTFAAHLQDLKDRDLLTEHSGQERMIIRKARPPG